MVGAVGFTDRLTFSKNRYFLLFICATTALANTCIAAKPKKNKKWTFIVYMAADNDLKGFAARNIKQMSAIGSNEFVTIAVHLDIRTKENKKITRRYLIEKNKVTQVNENDPATQAMDSGDVNTLISCCSWAIKQYPADHYALIFWNHGTGFLDPGTGRIINPLELFTFNPSTNKLELDRTLGFLDFISAPDNLRGVCWDDTTGNYLTNQKLDTALQTICSTYLHNKFDIIGFDACLMAGIEIVDLTKKYANIMVASQEVELGAGWNYELALAPFNKGCPDSKTLASHIVNAYAETYTKITNDYTLSAVDLDRVDILESTINEIALLLAEALRKQKNGSVKKTIKTCRSKQLCTHFDEPTYIDLHHFLSNLQTNLGQFSLTNSADETHIKNSLTKKIKDACTLIKKVAFANVAGNNLSKAQGISIYFPETNIHYSYRQTSFAANNAWLSFITQYLLL